MLPLYYSESVFVIDGNFINKSINQVKIKRY